MIGGGRPEVEQNDPDAVDRVEEDTGDQPQLGEAKRPSEQPVIRPGEDTAVDIHGEVVLGRVGHDQEGIDDVDDQKGKDAESRHPMDQPGPLADPATISKAFGEARPGPASVGSRSPEGG